MKRLATTQRCALLSALALVGLAGSPAGAFDHSHRSLDRTLKAHVRNALVDYRGLKAGRARLDDYLLELSRVAENEFRQWTESRQLAFLINAYNAFTLRLVIDHYPVTGIKEIGTAFRGPWDLPVVQLFGQTHTLNQLEHQLIRERHAEPRIHFALVCAALGCPPLRSEAYVADRLEEQLDDQARQFLGTAAKNRVDIPARTVHLSPIFKWYAEDFEKQHGSVLAALRPYWPTASAAALDSGQFSIRYTDYDWSLNQDGESRP